MPDRSRVMTQTKGIPWSSRLGFGVGLTTPHSNKKLFLRKSKKGKSWMDLNMMERVGDG
jgi:hypothetical protein